MPSPSRQRRPHWSDRRLPQQLRSQPSVRNGLRAWVCGLGLCVLHEAAFQGFHQIDDLGRLSNRTRVVTSPFVVASTSSPCASIAVSETRRLKSAGSPFNDRRGAVQVEDLGGIEAGRNSPTPVELDGRVSGRDCVNPPIQPCASVVASGFEPSVARPAGLVCRGALVEAVEAEGLGGGGHRPRQLGHVARPRILGRGAEARYLERRRPGTRGSAARARG
jgi:hypothetical protein